MIFHSTIRLVYLQIHHEQQRIKIEYMPRCDRVKATGHDLTRFPGFAVLIFYKL
jgi:hypothetical protein